MKGPILKTLINQSLFKTGLPSDRVGSLHIASSPRRLLSGSDLLFFMVGLPVLTSKYMKSPHFTLLREAEVLNLRAQNAGHLPQAFSRCPHRGVHQDLSKAG